SAPPQRIRQGGAALTPPGPARTDDATLNALRTDYLDILLPHECSLTDARAPETSRFIERLRADGKIRRFGIATDFPATVAILEAAPQAMDVAQFASDALDPKPPSLPPDWAGLVITHSPLKRVLP